MHSPVADSVTTTRQRLRRLCRTLTYHHSKLDIDMKYNDKARFRRKSDAHCPLLHTLLHYKARSCYCASRVKVDHVDQLLRCQQLQNMQIALAKST